jgi:dihydroorotate dehydrogenase (NAD+) catalytic subunit
MDGMTIDFSRPKYDLSISPPLMNAAGSLGYFPEPSGLVDYSQLGAFITNPISLQPRTPARSRTCIAYPGGFLLHSGYPNPGLRAAIRRYAQRWARSSIPVIVHLLVQLGENVSQMIPHLEELEGVMGIELGLSPEVDPTLAVELVQAAVGELPLIVRVPMEKAGEIAQSLAESPLTAISLAPPRGALIDRQGQRVRGRLFGPGVFPLALAAVQEMTEIGVPVIAAGGVHEPWQAEAFMEAGAIGVQLDAVLWSMGWQGNGGK